MGDTMQSICSISVTMQLQVCDLLPTQRQRYGNQKWKPGLEERVIHVGLFSTLILGFIQKKKISPSFLIYHNPAGTRSPVVCRYTLQIQIGSSPENFIHLSIFSCLKVRHLI